MTLAGLVPALSPGQWLLGALCGLFVGMAKTGVPGLGIFVVPLMVITVGDARQSAGWLLPLLCVADVFAVVAYRRHAQARRLLSLLPWVLIGMVAGALALGSPEWLLRRVVGAIVLAMVILRLARSWRATTRVLSPDATPSRAQETARAAGYGLVAGFATTVANAAGPVMNLYLLAKRLPKEEFIATGAWFFLFINLAKLPLYAGHGLIHARSLVFDLLCVPAVMVGALSGRRIAARLPQRAFEVIVLLLTTAAALVLLLRR
jgi:uncharacterized membrane protein YfcA